MVRPPPVHTPYTLDFYTSFFIAQSSAALMLSALILFWRFGSPAARVTMGMAVWLAAVAWAIAPFLVSIGYKPDAETLQRALAFSAALGVMTALLAGRFPLALVGVAASFLLWKLDHFVQESDAEICALHLAWLGLLLGLLIHPPEQRATAVGPPAPERSYVVHDSIVFVAATALAAIVCLAVMRKRDGTGDEWAYTYQAAVFAKGHAFGQTPSCQAFLQSFWVFEHDGRLFSQYTPGWPLFLVPFIWVHAVWMGGPVAHGLLAVGIARFARSAMRGIGVRKGEVPARIIAAAGTWGAVLAMLGTMILITAASRYAHTLAVALYVWSLEGIAMLSSPGLEPSQQRSWGLVLGSAAALMLGTRPEMGLLGLGIAAFFLLELARGRIGWRGVAAATAGFVFWSALLLVILRLQLGEWFKTGYSLHDAIHPWNKTKYDMPGPTQWKYGLPLGVGSYCWWPCSLALGLAGLGTLRGRAGAFVVAFGLGFLVYIFYFEWLDVGQRGYDWGYGPRYHMPLLVLMAAGGGVALAPLAVAARERVARGRWVLERGGPMALALFAIVSGWARIVPLVWPTAADHVHRHAGLTRTIEERHLENAVVIAQRGTTGFDVLDLTTNLPVDLYPDQPTIIAFDVPPGSAIACLRKAYPGRQFYSASGADDIRIVPY